MNDSDVEFYTVIENDKLIGYFGKEVAIGNVKYLTGFFINPEYRTKDYTSKFWNLIKDTMSGRFYCGLYKKNTPAIDFIVKNSGKLVLELDFNKSVIFQVEKDV